MAHYEHSTRDQKTGRFLPTLKKPQEKPKDPQAPPIEPPADHYEPRLSPAEQDRQDAYEQFLANHEARMERIRRANRPPAPDPDMNPRERRHPGTGPGGEPGDCGGAF